MLESKVWAKQAPNFISITIVMDHLIKPHNQLKNQQHFIIKVMAAVEIVTFFRITVVTDQTTTLVILENDCLRTH